MNSEDPGSNSEMISSGWLAKNIQQGHGPLGEVYPDVACGMEGDSPAFLELIQNGLNYPRALTTAAGEEDLHCIHLQPLPHPRWDLVFGRRI
jgi:hypothetical protein